MTKKKTDEATRGDAADRKEGPMARTSEEGTVNNEFENFDTGGFWNKVRRLIADIPVLRELVRRAVVLFHVMKDEDTPMKAKALIAAALVYLVCPLDAIPDVFGPLGYTDDAAALAAAWTAVEVYTKQEHLDAGDDFLRGAARPAIA